MNNVEEVKNR
jgi:hypothetical protein